jgi:hypothetical protein
MASDIAKWRGIPLDTPPDVYWAHREALQKLGAEGRLRLAFDISEQMWRTAKAGIRRRHPEYSEAQLQLAFIRMRLGEKLFRIKYPDEEVSP